MFNLSVDFFFYLLKICHDKKTYLQKSDHFSVDNHFYYLLQTFAGIVCLPSNLVKAALLSKLKRWIDFCVYVLTKIQKISLAIFLASNFSQNQQKNFLISALVFYTGILNTYLLISRMVCLYFLTILEARAEIRNICSLAFAEN